MKHFTKRGLTGALAAAAAGALVLSGCTNTNTNGGDGGDGDGGAEASGVVSIAVTNAVTALHATSQNNTVEIGMTEFLTGGGPGGMMYPDQDLNLIFDETNAKMELVSDSPLTVKYTLTEGAVWSDGTEMSVDDMLLSWVIGSGWFADGENEVFDLAGSTSGLDTTDFPEIDREAGTLTLKYNEPFVDWNLVGLIGTPAHVYAKQVDMTPEELTEHLQGLAKGSATDEVVQQLGEWHNNGYLLKAMPTDPDVLVSAGPYVVSDFQPDDGGFIQFSPNPNWKGKPVSVETIILKFLGDPSTQIQQLANGEVNIIEPAADADTLAALESNGAEIISGDTLNYEHLDLSFGREVFKDPKVREAFLLTIPRQQILDTIVKPLNPDAEILNSQIFVGSQDEYADAVAQNGYNQFDEVNIERAKELLEGKTPDVTILYNINNPNRVNQFKLIQQSAGQAGFNVIDGGSATWGEDLGGDTYDAALFGWSSPGVGYVGLPQVYHSVKDGKGGGNYNQYSNPEVDKLIAESQTLIDNPERMKEIQIAIDTATAEDFYGLPLWQKPGIVAHDGSVEGLVWNHGQRGVLVNVLDWKTDNQA